MRLPLVSALVIAAWLAIPMQPAVSASRPARYTVRELPGLPGRPITVGNAINNRGQIVGVASAGAEPGIPVMWDHGRVIDLRARGLPGTAEGINDEGVIVGVIPGPDGSARTRAYVWRAGNWHPLAGLTAPAAAAYGINNRGQIIGAFGTPDPESKTLTNSRVFLWDRGKVTVIPFEPRFPDDQRAALNNRGAVIGTFGWSGTPAPPSRVLLWRRDRRRQFLWLGGPYNVAGGINDQGQVVGGGYFEPYPDSDDFGEYHAVLWERGRYARLERLIPPDSGWQIEDAKGINNRGQIVGAGRRRGKERAFLLTPAR